MLATLSKSDPWIAEHLPPPPVGPDDISDFPILVVRAVLELRLSHEKADHALAKLTPIVRGNAGTASSRDFQGALAGFVSTTTAKRLHVLWRRVAAEGPALALVVSTMPTALAAAHLQDLPMIGEVAARRISYYQFGVALHPLDGETARAGRRYAVFRDEYRDNVSMSHDDAIEVVRAYAPPGTAARSLEVLRLIGHTYCLPRIPDCQHCPLERSCPRLL